VFALVLLLALNGATTTIENASFEEVGRSGRPVHWHPGASFADEAWSRVTIDETIAHAGRHSLRIASDEANLAYALQRLKVEPRAVYRIAAWVRTEGVDTSSVGACLAIRGRPNLAGDVRGDTDGWREVQLILKTGEGVERVDLMLQLGDRLRLNRGRAWFDDVSIEKLAEVPAGEPPVLVKTAHEERGNMLTQHPLFAGLAGLALVGGALCTLWWRRTGGRTSLSPTRLIVTYALAALVLWLLLLRSLGVSLMQHSFADQHSLQALAWLKGSSALSDAPDGLELVEEAGRVFVSFPPVPTLIELPLVLYFSRETPNTLVVLLLTWCTSLLCVLLLRRLTGNVTLALLATVAFFWGSSVLHLSLEGSVWHQGQVIGLLLALAALASAHSGRGRMSAAFSGALLGLAVGCRPFHLFTLPFLIYVATRRRRFAPAVGWLIAGLAIPLAALACYNWVRFGQPTEFGHTFLPHSRALPHGIFSLVYLARNVDHIFLRLPEWDFGRGILSFSARGTAFWLTNPVWVLAFLFFVARDIPRSERILGGASLAIHWSILLLHESNGWTQFGYRYGVDLLPLLIFFFGRAFRHGHWSFVVLTQYAVLINLYGALWYYVLRYA
jgi:hypothetical protein